MLARTPLLLLLTLHAVVGFIALPTSRLLSGATNSLRSLKGPTLQSFDPHKSLDYIPDTLLKDIDGNDSIRKRFETVLRSAQVIWQHQSPHKYYVYY
jgi:hypothetical protein